MLDPITSLAFSMQTAKGVNALLLGSGISRSAKIPTGWEITLELVRKIAAAQGAGELPGDTAAAWYRDTFGAEPDYAQLLDGLAKTPAERQQVLKNYIEPDAAERARGDKLATPAHHAIAKLVAAGYVRVIITTNFDRLLEDALKEQGISAIVITSAYAAAGAVPLVHAGCTLIKVHGDYLDTRIRNTPAELASYEPAIDNLLDQVFDEFGLIVCGWSADWDWALRAAIERAPSRRYSMYWAARGSPSTPAGALIKHRAGVQLPIASADTFFEELAQKVSALEAFNTPHPLSAELAVSMLKEYLADPKDRIRLDDLIAREFERVAAALDSPAFKASAVSTQVVDDLMRRYVATCSTLVAMAFTAGRWSTGDQVDVWVEIVRALGVRGKNGSGYRVLVDLLRVPAGLVLHAFGLGAVASRRHAELGRLLTHVIDFGGADSGPMPAGDRLNASTLFSDGGQKAGRHIKGYENRVEAVSDFFADTLRPVAGRAFRDQVAFERAFATLELVLAVGVAERDTPNRTARGYPFWAPTGRFAHDAALRHEILDGWRDEAKRSAITSLSVMAGLKEAPLLDEVEQIAARFRFS